MVANEPVSVPIYLVDQGQVVAVDDSMGSSTVTTGVCEVGLVALLEALPAVGRQQPAGEALGDRRLEHIDGTCVEMSTPHERVQLCRAAALP